MSPWNQSTTFGKPCILFLNLSCASWNTSWWNLCQMCPSNYDTPSIWLSFHTAWNFTNLTHKLIATVQHWKQISGPDEVTWRSQFFCRKTRNFLTTFCPWYEFQQNRFQSKADEASIHRCWRIPYTWPSFQAWGCFVWDRRTIICIAVEASPSAFPALGDISQNFEVTFKHLQVSATSSVQGGLGPGPVADECRSAVSKEP